MTLAALAEALLACARTLDALASSEDSDAEEAAASIVVDTSIAVDVMVVL